MLALFHAERRLLDLSVWQLSEQWLTLLVRRVATRRLSSKTAGVDLEDAAGLRSVITVTNRDPALVPVPALKASTWIQNTEIAKLHKLA
jgi:hypothetical protein